MSQIVNSFYDMRILDDMARRRSYIHDIHPVVKVMVTVFYLVAVVSFPRHEIIGLLPFFIYPVAVFTLGDLAFMPILKRLLFVEPFIIGIGLLSPFFEPLGWFTFASIVIKSSLTVTAALLLIATTGMDKLGLALRLFRIPKIFVLQLMLTYRYISVLLEEFSKTILAYSLRAPGQKGIHFSS